MASGLQVWSKVPANNANADSNVNWAEGMAPSAVNDSARSMMASMANWRDDNNGTLVTSGSSTAYTVVTNQIASALSSGNSLTVQFHVTNDSSATLAPDGLAAKPMQLIPGNNLAGQEFQAGTVQQFTYSTTGTGQWIGWSSIRASTSAGALILPFVTKSTTADITINSTTFIDGPSVSVTTSTSGVAAIWFVSATATCFASNANPFIIAKIWDGTSTIASAITDFPGVGNYTVIPLSGVISAPVGNLRLSARINPGGTSYTMTGVPSATDVVNTSTITAVRIG